MFMIKARFDMRNSVEPGQPCQKASIVHEIMDARHRQARGSRTPSRATASYWQLVDGLCCQHLRRLAQSAYSGDRRRRLLNGSLRDELLNEELFDSPAEARRELVVWRSGYNNFRPHSYSNRWQQWSVDANYCEYATMYSRCVAWPGRQRAAKKSQQHRGC